MKANTLNEGAIEAFKYVLGVQTEQNTDTVNIAAQLRDDEDTYAFFNSKPMAGQQHKFPAAIKEVESVVQGRDLIMLDCGEMENSEAKAIKPIFDNFKMVRIPLTGPAMNLFLYMHFYHWHDKNLRCVSPGYWNQPVLFLEYFNIKTVYQYVIAEDLDGNLEQKVKHWGEKTLELFQYYETVSRR